MNRKVKKSVFALSIILCIIILFLIYKKINANSKNNVNNIIENKNNSIGHANNIEIDKNQIEYQNNVTVDELKQDLGKTGNTELYEISTEYDGRKYLQVKPNLKYKVAFVGMLTKKVPKFDELDNMYGQNAPKNNGIWVEQNSRQKIQEYLNNKEIFKSEYEIDSNGYIQVKNSEKQNDNDTKLQNTVNKNKQYILDISSICYIIDDVSGKILDYNFEKMDEYQTYEYFNDNDKTIIFINKNTNNQMSDKEIFESVLDLMQV